MRFLSATALLVAFAPACPAGAASFTQLFQASATAGWSTNGRLVWLPEGVVGAGTGVTLFARPVAAGGQWTARSIYYPSGQAGDGAYPVGGVVLSGTALFGATSGGGDTACANGCGTVYRMDRAGGGWSVTQLIRFHNDAGGFQPNGAPLVRGGRIYGVSARASNDTMAPGGDVAGGVVYALTPKAGGGYAASVLHHFDAAGKDGSLPAGELAAVGGPLPVLYGTTFLGGRCGYGTVFKLSPPATAKGAWTETLVHEFGVTDSGCDYGDGSQPVAGVVLANGVLYGSTRAATSTECGTVFSIDVATGAYRRLATFGEDAGDACSPQAPLKVDANGVIAGTSAHGGGTTGTACPYGCGTVFTLTPDGAGGYTKAVLHAFNGTDGIRPRSALIGMIGGALGSVTEYGGKPGDLDAPDYTTFGSLFRIK